MTVAGVLTVLAVTAGASIGACVRFVVSNRFNGPFPSGPFPYGTLVVNVAAAFLAGLGSQLAAPWSTIVLIGMLGTLSTWSTVAVEVGALARDGDGRVAALYLVASVTTGLLAAWGGIQLAP